MTKTEIAQSENNDHTEHQFDHIEYNNLLNIFHS